MAMNAPFEQGNDLDSPAGAELSRSPLRGKAAYPWNPLALTPILADVAALV